jgi:hypothetical protein
LPSRSNISYSIYICVKYLRLSPVWILLFTGDYNSWVYLCKIFYKVHKKKVLFLDPKIVLMFIIKFILMPVNIKKYMTDFCFFNSVQNFIDDESFKEFTDSDKILPN